MTVDKDGNYTPRSGAEWIEYIRTQKAGGTVLTTAAGANGPLTGGHWFNSKEVFETGAQRDNRSGKGRFDLLPPEGLRRLALVMERGCNKYGERNWEKGMPVARYLDSAMRHIIQYAEGLTDEDHLGQAAWNLLAAITTEERSAKGQLPRELQHPNRRFEDVA